MATIIKELGESCDRLMSLYRSVHDHQAKLEEHQRSVKKLFDDLLTDANWSNHDSRRFKRHYVKGDAALAKDLGALKNITEGLVVASSRYTELEEQVNGLFADSLWKESLLKDE